MMFNKHDDVMGKFTAELKVAKLTQAVNDKDQELFESQELAASLLEALNNLYGAVDAVGYINTTIIHPAMLNARRAIRKATT